MQVPNVASPIEVARGAAALAADNVSTAREGRNVLPERLRAAAPVLIEQWQQQVARAAFVSTVHAICLHYLVP